MKGKVNVKRYFQVLGICLAVLLVGLMTCLGFGFWQGNTDGLSDEEIATVDEIVDGKINILLMGVDENGMRTDSIMLVTYNTETNEAKLLSIPRDTRMYIGSRFQKINAAHALSAGSGKILGAQGTVEAVSRLTGIPINYYMDFSFDAVAKCIDLLGPVTFEIPDLYNDGVGMVYDDPAQNLHINLKPGVQELNGEQVVHLLRYRKGNKVNGVRRSYANGDIGRIEVQQKFLKALVDQKLNPSLILKLPAMFKQLAPSVKTNLSVKEVVKYSKYLTDFSSVQLNVFALPGNSKTIDGASYWVCDMDATKELIETEFGYDASNATIEKDLNTESKSSNGDTKSDAKATQKATATKKPSSNVQATKKPSTSTKSPSSQSSSSKSDSTSKPASSATKEPTATKKPESQAAAPTKGTANVPEKKEDSAVKSTKTPVKIVKDDAEDSEAG